MTYKIDFSAATSHQVESALGNRLESIRLSRNMTQVQLATEAGVSTGTVRRMEKGKGVSLDTFIRVLIALGIQGSLATLLPDPSVRPMERIGGGAGERRRARPGATGSDPTGWTWGDDEDDDAS